MKKIFPDKLKVGDTVKMISPSIAYSSLEKRIMNIAQKRIEELGLKITYAKNSRMKHDEFRSTPIKSRVADIHEAFRNKKTKAVICVIGGYNSNQLLDYIDWKIIKNNFDPYVTPCFASILYVFSFCLESIEYLGKTK